MNPFPFFLGLMTFVLLLSAWKLSQSNPVGAALSHPHIFCKEQVAWSAEIVTDDSIDYTIFWIAFDATTAQDHFKYVYIDVTLDGESLSEQMKYMQVPEPYSVICTDRSRQFEASRMKFTLFLPPLFPGSHIILWKYRVTTDLDDGVFDYPSGMTGEFAVTTNLE
ncbi:MAG TPA: hypothetical protein VK206_25930 [Anaerolineales bacterium]|nr:hypothetical protein [Anaerolineales bacterium]